MTPSNPLVFFGTEDFSTTILSRLIASGYTIKAVVTKADSVRGRGRKLTPPGIKQVALDCGIPVIQPVKLSEHISELTNLNCQHAVLVAYGKIIPGSVLDIFPGGIINVHPSLLPRYRGSSPIESAILHGDERTGVTLMKLVEAMDAGPIYAQTEYPLTGRESRPELYDILASAGSSLLIDRLPGILEGNVSPQPQNDADATYCQLIKKDDGRIDWNQPAAQIERTIRAYLGWPGSRMQVFGADITILEAEVDPLEITIGKAEVIDGKFLVGASDQRSLSIKKLRPSGRSSMDIADFLRGLKA